MLTWATFSTIVNFEINRKTKKKNQAKKMKIMYPFFLSFLPFCYKQRSSPIKLGMCAVRLRVLTLKCCCFFYLQILGALCQDGVMRFINIHSCKLLFDIGELSNKINNASVSPNGRYIVTVNEDGGVGVYNLQTLSTELNKVRRFHL